MAGPRRRAAGGFTLLEVLVAMAIFAVISVLTMQGLREMTASRTRLLREGERLAAVQSAFAILGRDLEQAVGRRIRDEYGNQRPALLGGEREPDAVELTRGGFRNPSGRPRSSMQRIAYRLSEGSILRRVWPVLDRASNAVPESQPLLAEVSGFKVEFLDRNHKWCSSWPAEEDALARQGALPKAMRVTIELADWGTVARVFPVGGS